MHVSLLSKQDWWYGTYTTSKDKNRPTPLPCQNSNNSHSTYYKFQGTVQKVRDKGNQTFYQCIWVTQSKRQQSTRQQSPQQSPSHQHSPQQQQPQQQQQNVRIAFRRDDNRRDDDRRDGDKRDGDKRDGECNKCVGCCCSPGFGKKKKQYKSLRGLSYNSIRRTG